MRLKTFLISILSLCAGSFIMNAQPAEEGHVYGTVTDTDGKPVPGVVVTDGFTAVATDAQGKYSFKAEYSAAYIYYSIPADCEIPIRYGHPFFFKRHIERTYRYDFVVQKRKKGVENDFNLILMGDPQSQNTHHIRRFANETIPDLNAFVKKQKNPCYGVTLGDIIYTEKHRDASYVLNMMREEMKVEKTGMAMFQTIGNHDYIWDAVELSKYSPTPSVRANRFFTDLFGPLDYSWNRGQVHIVSMNNIRYKTLNKWASYTGDFTDEQVEWLRQDLQFVPKDHLVVFCVHIPMIGMVKRSENAAKVLELLGQFENCRIISGHTHALTHHVHANGIKEHTVGAASGIWWWSSTCGEGTPNGYAVARINGNQVEEVQYKATGYDLDHQLRVYRGDAEFGGEHEKFKLQHGHDVILANVWNFQEGWQVKVYEDGKYTGNMTLMPVTNEFVPTADSSKDWWAISYPVGVVGRGHIANSTRNNYCSKCAHMFRYELKNPDAKKIKVEAVDAHGNKYSTTEIIEGADYRQAAPPAYGPDPIW